MVSVWRTAVVWCGVVWYDSLGVTGCGDRCSGGTAASMTAIEQHSLKPLPPPPPLPHRAPLLVPTYNEWEEVRAALLNEQRTEAATAARCRASRLALSVLSSSLG